jgi:hypothetical protein
MGRPRLSQSAGGFFCVAAVASNSTDQLQQTFHHFLHRFGCNEANPLARPLSRDRTHLRNLHPRLFRQRCVFQLQGEREPGALRLAGQSHRDHGFRARVEETVTQYEDGTEARLLAPANRIEVGPNNIAPQYGGHASAPIPSSASFFSPIGFSLANSRASSVSRKAMSRRIAGPCCGSDTCLHGPIGRDSATVFCSRVMAIFWTIGLGMTHHPTASHSRIRWPSLPANLHIMRKMRHTRCHTLTSPRLRRCSGDFGPQPKTLSLNGSVKPQNESTPLNLRRGPYATRAKLAPDPAHQAH